MHEDIGVLDQAVNDLLALLLYQVYGEAPLAAVVGLEVSGLSIRKVAGGSHYETAAGITGDTVFNMDHGSPQVSQQRRCHRSHLPLSPVKHFNTIKRSGHFLNLLSCMIIRLSLVNTR